SREGRGASLDARNGTHNRYRAKTPHGSEALRLQTDHAGIPLPKGRHPISVEESVPCLIPPPTSPVPSPDSSRTHRPHPSPIRKSRRMITYSRLSDVSTGA